MELEQLKQLVNSDAFIAVREYIYNKCQELKDITNLEEHSVATAQALELKAQKKAYLKLKDILGQLMDWEAVVNRESPENIKKNNDFGL